MKAWMSAVVFLVAANLASTALAQCCVGKAKTDESAAKTGSASSCHKDKSACTKGDDLAAGAECRGKLLAAAGAPLMTYKVGDKSTACPKQAAEWATGQDVQVRYVVNDTEYTDKPEALKAYEAALEQHLGNMTSVRYAVGKQCVGCPNAAATLAKESGESVKYRVAAFTFADREQAEKAAEAARAASAKVTLTCIVDGKEYACDQEAKRACQAKDGETAAKTCEYKVGGTKTPCQVTAKVELATARIVAAYKAVEDLGGKNNAGTEVAAGT
jgi:hypothetical protein